MRLVGQAAQPRFMHRAANVSSPSRHEPSDLPVVQVGAGAQCELAQLVGDNGVALGCAEPVVAVLGDNREVPAFEQRHPLRVEHSHLDGEAVGQPRVDVVELLAAGMVKDAVQAQEVSIDEPAGRGHDGSGRGGLA